MNKIKMDVVEKQTKKDNVGNVTHVFEAVGTIQANYLLPSSNDNAVKQYGFEENTTHTTTTRANVPINSFLQYKGKTYRVRFVAHYPKHNVLLLEVI